MPRGVQGDQRRDGVRLYDNRLQAIEPKQLCLVLRASARWSHVTQSTEALSLSH